LVQISRLLKLNHRTLRRWAINDDIPGAYLTERGRWRVQVPPKVDFGGWIATDIETWLLSQAAAATSTPREEYQSDFDEAWRVINRIDRETERDSCSLGRRRVTAAAVCKVLGCSRATFYRKPGYTEALDQYWKVRKALPKEVVGYTNHHARSMGGVGEKPEYGS
jgi:predicted DNA-binding transcriptional regulator AlpA